MKKQLLTLSFALCAAFGYSQSNTFPPTGNAGINTTTPTTKLDVLLGQILSAPTLMTHNIAFFGLRSVVVQPQTPTNTGLYIQRISYPGLNGGVTSKLLSTINDNSLGYTEFNTPKTTNTTQAALTFGNAGVELMRINQNGKVRIGLGTNDIKTPDGYKLFVEEGILTEKVKVAVKTTTDWADYVFADDYNLMPLSEVEKFTKENKHLPNVPSASEMVNGGLDVAKMDAKLLEKIEELTLYVIKQAKEIEDLKVQVKSLTEKR